MKEKQQQSLAFVILSIFIIMSCSSIANQISIVSTPTMSREIVQSTPSDLSGMDVALYVGGNSEASNACRTAMKHLFEWMNATVSFVNASEIKTGRLYDYDLFALPPGNLFVYSVDLGNDGLEMIRNFVQYGGSFFAIAGGAIFACSQMKYGTTESEYNLQLYNGTAKGPIAGVPDQSIFTVNVNTSSPDIDLSGFSSSLSTLYWGATYFESDEMQNVIPICTYPDTGRHAMITYQYGSGFVFLSGVHPEFEEDSSRDGSDLFDNLDDPESEWALLKHVTEWMLASSVKIDPPTTNLSTSLTASESATTNTTNGHLFIEPLLLGLGGFAAAIIVLSPVIIKFRKRSSS